MVRFDLCLRAHHLIGNGCVMMFDGKSRSVLVGVSTKVCEGRKNKMEPFPARI